MTQSLKRLAAIFIASMLAHGIDDANAGAVQEETASSSAVVPRVFETERLTASSGGPEQRFGKVLSMAGDTIAVWGRPVTVFQRQGMRWVEQEAIELGGLGYPAISQNRLAVALDDATHIYRREDDGWIREATHDVVGMPALSDDILISCARGEVRVHRRLEDQWRPDGRLSPNEPRDGQRFGYSAAVDGNLAVVGAIYDDASRRRSGAAYVFRYTDGAWIQEATLLADNPADGDFFGGDVAVSGNRVLVGAREHDAAGPGSGAAFVYAHDAGRWIREATLTAHDALAGERFGMSVALDGNRAIVGATFDDDVGEWTGAMYLFERDGAAWFERAKLVASDAASNDRLGWDVGLSGDFAVGGAHGHDIAGNMSGAGYVFRVDVAPARGPLTSGDSSDRLPANAPIELDASVPNTGFGLAVALHGDELLIGAPQENARRGAAYRFRHSEDTWTQEARLESTHPKPGELFGRSVALGETWAIVGSQGRGAYAFHRRVGRWRSPTRLGVPEGRTGDAVAASRSYVILGAPDFQEPGQIAPIGAAFIFIRQADAWSDPVRLQSTRAAYGDFFGTAVALHRDYAIVGAGADYEFQSSSAYACIFRRQGPEWVEAAQLTSGETPGRDSFGSAVAIEDDLAVVGAMGDDDAGVNAGAVYVFRRQGADWSLDAKLHARDADTGHLFGAAVAINESRIAIAAPFTRAGTVSSGAVYIFLRSADGWTQHRQVIQPSGRSTIAFSRAVAIHGNVVAIGGNGRAFVAPPGE